MEDFEERLKVKEIMLEDQNSAIASLKQVIRHKDDELA